MKINLSSNKTKNPYFRLEYFNPNTGKIIKDEVITADNKYFPLKGTLTDTEKINLSFQKGDKDLLEKQLVAKLLFNGYKFEAMK